LAGVGGGIHHRPLPNRRRQKKKNTGGGGKKSFRWEKGEKPLRIGAGRCSMGVTGGGEKTGKKNEKGCPGRAPNAALYTGTKKRGRTFKRLSVGRRHDGETETQLHDLAGGIWLRGMKKKTSGKKKKEKFAFMGRRRKLRVRGLQGKGGNLKKKKRKKKKKKEPRVRRRGGHR